MRILTYDGHNRPIFKDLSDNTYSQDVSYSYDLRGLMLTSRFGSDEGLGETLQYDGFGHLRMRNSTLTGASRPLYSEYDANGNRTRLTHPDGYFFQYSFDGLNRLLDVGSSNSNLPTANNSWLLGVRYGADGKRMYIERPGNSLTSYFRDNALRLDSFNQDFASANDSRGIAKLSTGSAIAVSANGRWGDAGRRSTANTVLDLANAIKGGSSNAPSTTNPCP